MICILNCSSQFINKYNNDYIRDYHFREGLQKLILSQFNLDIDYIFYNKSNKC